MRGFPAIILAKTGEDRPMRYRSMTRCPLRSAVSGLCLAAALFVAGCASPGPPAAGGEQFNDPYENTNRQIFAFNQSVDKNVLVPVAKTYRSAFPDPIRDAIRDFLNNLRGPIILANDLLQANGDLAKDTFARFMINTTIGVGGIVDLAGRWGIPYHEQDFGLTLAVWGVQEGPYLVVPVLGPSNPRDLGGTVAEGLADPGNIVAGDYAIWIPIVRGAVSGIDQRSRYIETLADLERTSLDYYATIRSIYRQRRAALARHQRENLPPNPSLSLNGGGLAAVPPPELAAAVPRDPVTR